MDHGSDTAAAVSSQNTTRRYFEHFSGKVSSTNTVLTASLKAQYPHLRLSVLAGVDLLGFADGGNARCISLDDDATNANLPSSVVTNTYLPPSRRAGGSSGAIAQNIHFGKFLYQWQDHDFILYVAYGLDGDSGLSSNTFTYLLSSDERTSEALILAAGSWTSSLHEEIWVFDGGYWSKNAALYRSVMKSSWDAVVLDANMKKDLINDHLYFFQSRDTYQRLKVPWRRGIIYHGPPGNGKTISIKAMMHTLYDLQPQVPTLYVRSLASFMGPERSIKDIFSKARQSAPCYLVFEDLDSLVSDSARSYFLNEVDGLKDNDGIFMIGSTNHLDRLDPGISAKLKGNEDLSFPDKLCDAIAGITDGFSFAYMQEAFVAALLAIARDEKPGGIVAAVDVLTVDGADDWVEVLDGSTRAEDPELDHLVLWVEIKKQIRILREGMGEDDGHVGADLVSA
ncbi:hypothetical protein ED733_008781 [Metarhizium rileyi]|uniref:ATPase AAA-type core domain-containing protein n=1 Tax=Metarhizium rileyi (strain RCEF 4871) TaxID=1649241 RepID=A0A5C6GQ10_METRR|nr:hypothetical protein ED733_008781 [Metarhizium rileyi]